MEILAESTRTRTGGENKWRQVQVVAADAQMAPVAVNLSLAREAIRVPGPFGEPSLGAAQPAERDVGAVLAARQADANLI